MNKQRGRHMAPEHQDGEQRPALPSIHIHSHSGGHTVHILHPDGGHEKHEHAHGDAEGIAQHIHDHLGGEPGAGADRSEEYGEGADGTAVE